MTVLSMVAWLAALSVGGAVAQDAARDPIADAAVHARRAEAARSAGDRQTMAAELVAACVANQFADLVRGVDLCTRAIDAAETLHRNDWLGQALAYRAALESWRGEFDDGVRDGTRATALLRDSHDTRTLPFAEVALGTLYRERGDAGQALEHLGRGIDAAVSTGDRETESLGRAMRARALFWMGEYEQARREADQAADLARRLRNPALEFMAVWQRAMADLDAGNSRESIPLHERAFELARQLHHPGATMMQINLADAFARLGRMDEADQQLKAVRADLVKGLAPPLWRPYVDEIEGVVRMGQGRYDEARRQYARAATGSASAWLTVRARLGEARSLVAAGSADAAIDAYERTLADVEQARATATADEQRAAFMAANGSAYRELIAVLWSRDGPAAAGRAFDIAERGRARALLDALGASRLRSTATAPLTAEETQRRLTQRQVLVEYVVASDSVFAFRLTNSDIRWIRLDGVQPASLEARITFFRQLLQTASSDDIAPVARRLYADLLAPVLGDLTDDRDTLILSADDVLNYLPFEAMKLPPAKTGSPPFLVERYVVTYAASASLALRPVTNGLAARPLLVVANPLALEIAATDAVGARRAATAPLPNSAIEARTVAGRVGGQTAVLIGADASETRVKQSGLGAFRVLHFATHAFIDDTLPLRSALWLGRGDQDDGFLEAREIYALTLGADLVVLSGCDTGAGRALGSEGVQSLARAFLYAGAHAVVATLWKVEDRSSVDVMSQFYSDLADRRSVAEALTATKRRLIRDGTPPRSWAAFVVVGSAAVTPGARAVAIDRWWSPFIAIAALLLAIAGFGLWRRRATRIPRPMP